MKKYIFIFLIFFTFLVGSLANCESLPDIHYRKHLNSEDNPIYYKYLEDYHKQLKQVFENTKYRGNHVGGGYEYIVHRDGSITDIKIYLIDTEKFNKIIKSIIVNNPPPPFYKGMDVEEMHFETFLGIENFAEDRIEYYAYINNFDIQITKKHKFR